MYRLDNGVFLDGDRKLTHKQVLYILNGNVLPNLFLDSYHEPYGSNGEYAEFNDECLEAMRIVGNNQMVFSARPCLEFPIRYYAFAGDQCLGFSESREEAESLIATYNESLT